MGGILLCRVLVTFSPWKTQVCVSTPALPTHSPPTQTLRHGADQTSKVLMSSADCFSVSEAKRSKIWASASASIAAVGSSKMSLGSRWWRMEDSNMDRKVLMVQKSGKLTSWYGDYSPLFHRASIYIRDGCRISTISQHHSPKKSLEMRSLYEVKNLPVFQVASRVHHLPCAKSQIGIFSH